MVDDSGSPAKIITCPKKLCKIFSIFFKRKTTDIQDKFNKDGDEQIEILEMLINKPKTELDIEFVTIDEVYQAI